MRMKRLGNTGLLVSELCLGTMTFGAGAPRASSELRVDAAHRGTNLCYLARGHEDLQQRAV